ncbi:ATP-binding protein [Burkholderia sp. BCC1644]|uniref:ATP-binding protein n=1 Tax=Burkholderia sp. BCC1644 TaxID=2676293 RepID=UPI0015928E67|nr:ATP-binding protein [Burkholderia sp. BCC1644]
MNIGQAATGSSPREVRARFRARLDALRDIASWVRAESERDAAPAWVDQLELAIVEAASNAMRHGGATSPARVGQRDFGIVLVLRFRPDRVVVDLFDAGRAAPNGLFERYHLTPVFDPGHIEHLPESGMGLGILYACVDVVAYRRRLGINRLRLVKHRARG